METFVARISLWHKEFWFMFVSLLIQSIIQQIDCCNVKCEANKPAAVYPQRLSQLVGGGATSRIWLHHWPRADAHVLVSSAHTAVLSSNQARVSAATSPEFRCQRSAFPAVMERNTRFLLCLHLLTAVLGPLVLGKSRRAVWGCFSG